MLWKSLLLISILQYANAGPTRRTETFAGDNTDIDDNANVDCQTPTLLTRGTQPAPPDWALTNLCSAKKNKPFKASPYEYVDEAGKGVDVYIFDTGVTHLETEFGARVYDDVNTSDEDFLDHTGHGTKVASLVAGAEYGVAKSATIRSVKFRKNGKPNGDALVRALREVIDLHNKRKDVAGFRGSVALLSFAVTDNHDVNEALDDAWLAGITLVASAGNKGYQPDHFPSEHSRVISVGASTQGYNPTYVTDTEGSNFGRDVIQLWAPGSNIAVLDHNGAKQCSSGTSYSAAFVAGILAVFHGVKGPSLTPDNALKLLLANADDYMSLPQPPNGDTIDWRDSSKIVANTGYLKGQALDPPEPFLPIPASPAHSNPSPAPVQGCQSPDHHTPLVPFNLDQGDAASSSFISECQGVELNPGKIEGCTLYFNPCSAATKGAAVDVIMSVQQLSWKEGVNSTWPDRQEMHDIIGNIMNDCDLTTTEQKWGGFKSVEVSSGIRMYNVTANKNGQYPKISDAWTTVEVTSGGGDCDLWNST